MVMSQGTYTFLTCFAGFWLIWGLIVLLCCFCSYLRRRMKRQQEERLREQSLRTLELEPLHYEGYAGSPPGIAIPHRLRVEPHHPPHSSPAALELPARVGPVEAAVLRGGAADGGAAPAVQRGAHGHAGALPQDQRPLPEPRAAGEAGAAPQLQAPLPGHGLRLGAAPAPRRQPGAGLPGPLPAGRVLPAHVPQLDGLGAQQQGRLRAGALAPPRLHAPLRQDYGRVGGGEPRRAAPPPHPNPPPAPGPGPHRPGAAGFSLPLFPGMPNPATSPPDTHPGEPGRARRPGPRRRQRERGWFPTWPPAARLGGSELGPDSALFLILFVTV